MFLSDEGPILETLDFTTRIGSIPTFLYFDFNHMQVLLKKLPNMWKYIIGRLQLRHAIRRHLGWFPKQKWPALWGRLSFRLITKN